VHVTCRAALSSKARGAAAAARFVLQPAVDTPGCNVNRRLHRAARVVDTTSYTRVWLGVNWITDNQTQTVAAMYDDLVVSTRDVSCD
jgi:hypothetical protein